VLLVAVLAAYWLYCYVVSRSDTPSANLCVTQYIEDASFLEEEEDEKDGVEADNKEKKKFNHKHCINRAIAVVRSQIGVVRENSANRLVVGRKIRDAMQEMEMRPTHISRFAGMAVELYFVPTDDDLFARQIRRCSAKSRRTVGMWDNGGC
jgi:hypothetical protein